MKIVILRLSVCDHCTSENTGGEAGLPPSDKSCLEMPQGCGQEGFTHLQNREVICTSENSLFVTPDTLGLCMGDFSTEKILICASGDVAS